MVGNYTNTNKHDRNKCPSHLKALLINSCPVRGQAHTFGGFKPINGIPILLLIGSPTVNTDKNMLIYMIASIIFVTSISYLCYLFRKQAKDNYLYQTGSLENKNEIGRQRKPCNSLSTHKYKIACIFVDHLCQIVLFLFILHNNWPH